MLTYRRFCPMWLTLTLPLPPVMLERIRVRQLEYLAYSSIVDFEMISGSEIIFICAVSLDLTWTSIVASSDIRVFGIAIFRCSAAIVNIVIPIVLSRKILTSAPFSINCKRRSRALPQQRPITKEYQSPIPAIPFSEP